LVSTIDSAAQAEVPERLNSPNAKYSIEVARGAADSLLLSKGRQVVAKIPASVGPVGSFFEALWSPDGKYVAINKQRSSRPGGDEMWIVALPTRKLVRQPDDALWNELDEREDAYLGGKHVHEIGGKVFLILTAVGWENSRLRFKLEAGFSEIEDRYLFEGTFNPSDRKISDWKISKTQS